MTDDRRRLVRIFAVVAVVLCAAALVLGVLSLTGCGADDTYGKTVRRCDGKNLVYERSRSVTVSPDDPACPSATSSVLR